MRTFVPHNSRQSMLTSDQNLYAETTFVCPSYWVAEAFSGKGRAAYKYQHSVVGAQHGADVAGYFGPATPNFGPDFERAFMSTSFFLSLPLPSLLHLFLFISAGHNNIVLTFLPSPALWGNFIISNNPSLSPQIANGASSPNPSAPNPASSWPQFSVAQPFQINLNETGGTSFSAPGVYPSMNITEFRDPGLRNQFDLVDAYTWEGGRGIRCDFWRSVGIVVPE